MSLIFQSQVSDYICPLEAKYEKYINLQNSSIEQQIQISSNTAFESLNSVSFTNCSKQKLKTKGFLWKAEEDQMLREAINKVAACECKNQKSLWKNIASYIPGKTSYQCNQRWRKISNHSIKQKLTEEESEFIIQFVEEQGRDWQKLSSIFGGLWTGKQLRDKYLNQLNPNLIKSKWTQEEDNAISLKVQQIGTKWKEISKFLPGRSENAIKNRFNNSLKQKLKQPPTKIQNLKLQDENIKEFNEIFNEGLDQFKQENKIIQFKEKQEQSNNLEKNQDQNNSSNSQLL